MDFQQPTSAPKRRPKGSGFTLFEVMLVTFISAFVFAGVLSAYIFLGRGLSRQVNEQSQESQARVALYTLTQDVSTASAVYAASPGTGVSGDVMTLVIPGSANVTYSQDWSLGAGLGQLKRTLGSGTPVVLLKNLSTLAFTFYDGTSHAVTVSSSLPSDPQAAIKQVGLAYTSQTGSSAAGNVSQFTVVSPLIILRNKTNPTDPDQP
jgi:Tfp pilus assembly protein PilW